MKIGILSDTHGHMDDRILEHLKNCDQIWHAGDIGDLEVMRKLHKIAPLRGVHGNIDDHKIRIHFKEDLRFVCEGKSIYITHIAGRVPNYNERVRRIIRQFKPDILVCGHSHILKVQNDEKNQLLYINPGAAGRKGFHKVRTILRMDIKRGEISNLEVVELGQRSAKKISEDDPKT